MLAIRWIILYTMRTPLDRILVLVRQEHHNAVSLEALVSGDSHVGREARLLARRPPDADHPVGRSQQRRAPRRRLSS